MYVSEVRLRKTFMCPPFRWLVKVKGQRSLLAHAGEGLLNGFNKTDECCSGICPPVNTENRVEPLGASGKTLGQQQSRR